tara:strand:- start:9 stop:119 length:111 start_codon:yes stop_codon:yes gene_type:complete
MIKSDHGKNFNTRIDINARMQILFLDRSQGFIYFRF